MSKLVANECSGSDVLQCFPEVRKTSEMPKRKQIRIKEYDYSQPGYYFITICASEHKCLFGSLVGAAISRPQEQSNPVGAAISRPQLTEYGKYIEKSLSEIPKRYKNASVDKYVIMPNHVHIILVIADADKNGRMISAPTIPQIVGQMKRWVSKQAGFSCWQKSYYEHIIRNEREYQNICEYIENNPLKWELDKYYSTDKTGG